MIYLHCLRPTCWNCTQSCPYTCIATEFNIPSEESDSFETFPFLTIWVSSTLCCRVLGWEEAPPRFSSKIFMTTVRSSSLSAICKVTNPQPIFGYIISFQCRTLSLSIVSKCLEKTTFWFHYKHVSQSK